ncbi:hypothetical protein [Oceanospirillum sediminis]|uniref:Uncharacterized protein n=1 Tax=Oceanospirillum sediminis TaxID=2760088 RepID=A0A839IQQ0_9GAMM|nr:hypothetical protein [Oceanospirillum sediminis]MBB1486767.1 hypothetical protein [Oceanospirillum sediminis]
MSGQKCPLPRLKGITANGEEIELPELAEIQLEWEEGLPASLLINPEHLQGPSLTLEVGSGEDEYGALTEYGVIALRPGASNMVDINIETQPVDDEDPGCGDDCSC